MTPRPIESSAKDYKPAPAGVKTGLLDIFPAAKKPHTELAKYRILSPNAGVRVSPLCLGAMSLGDQWTGMMGSAVGPEESEKLLDLFYESGGNFIDTANNYQHEQSEIIIGEWMEKRGNREEIVLATKYTTFPLDRVDDRYEDHGLAVNFGGNHKKSLRWSVERSLKKLRTDYIDLLYLHWWEYSTSIEEVMRSLDDLVRSGKVLYLGISDTPAWIVSECNRYAKEHGLTPFSVYQGNWSLALRDMERDIIPMCRAHGMAIAPYGVLGSGKFKTRHELEERANSLRANTKPTEKQMQMCDALEEVAKEVGQSGNLTGVAMAWARQTMRDCYPILGGSKVSQLKQNIESLKIHLTEDQMQKLNSAGSFDKGFPYVQFGFCRHCRVQRPPLIGHA